MVCLPIREQGIRSISPQTITLSSLWTVCFHEKRSHTNFRKIQQINYYFIPIAIQLHAASVFAVNLMSNNAINEAIIIQTNEFIMI